MEEEEKKQRESGRKEREEERGEKRIERVEEREGGIKGGAECTYTVEPHLTDTPQQQTPTI